MPPGSAPGRWRDRTRLNSAASGRGDVVVMETLTKRALSFTIICKEKKPLERKTYMYVCLNFVSVCAESRFWSELAVDLKECKGLVPCGVSRSFHATVSKASSRWMRRVASLCTSRGLLRHALCSHSWDAHADTSFCSQMVLSPPPSGGRAPPLTHS